MKSLCSLLSNALLYSVFPLSYILDGKLKPDVSPNRSLLGGFNVNFMLPSPRPFSVRMDQGYNLE